MSFEEKSTWVMAVIVVVVYGWYFATVSSDLIGGVAVSDIEYRGMMLATVLALVALATVTHIAIAAASPRDADKSDERDKEINRFGEYIGGYVLAVGALTGMGLAMFEVDYFWIANAILAGLVLSEIVSGAVKIVLYRRGL